jgi:hypothetical protein
MLFTTFLEWEIGLLLCFAVAVAALGLPGKGTAARPLPALAAILVGTLAFVYVVKEKFSDEDVVARARSFFGVVSVEEWDRGNPAEHESVLRHGRITHGRQFVDPAKRRIPTSYYTYNSGVGRAITYCTEASNGRALRVGTVGLGVGTLATYARPGDDYRFFEINPDILWLAEEYFTFLSDCRGRWDVVMGDARLSLERELDEEGPHRYDVLVLDAFSGDSIPQHLLTAQAFDLYNQHLAPDGVIAVHVSNRYLKLAPVVYGQAEDYGLQVLRVCTGGDAGQLAYPANWMLLTRNERFLREVKAEPPDDDDEFEVPRWTDDYNNIFQLLKR